MADYHDYAEAVQETERALSNLGAATGRAEDTGERTALVVGLGLEAVVLAIREASVRADYVLRDEGKRRGHG